MNASQIRTTVSAIVGASPSFDDKLKGRRRMKWIAPHSSKPAVQAAVDAIAPGCKVRRSSLSSVRFTQGGNPVVHTCQCLTVIALD